MVALDGIPRPVSVARRLAALLRQIERSSQYSNRTPDRPRTPPNDNNLAFTMRTNPPTVWRNALAFKLAYTFTA